MDVMNALGATVIRSHTLGISVGLAKSLEPHLDEWNEDGEIHIPAMVRLRHLAQQSSRTVSHDNLRENQPATQSCSYCDRDAQGNYIANFFYTRPDIIAAFKRYINKIITHKNKYNGLTYAEDTAIIAFATGNDLSGPHDGDQQVPNSWTQDIARYIKSLSPEKLIVDGTQGVNRDHFAVEEIDIFTDHQCPPNVAKMKDDIAAVGSADRVFLVEEYDWRGIKGDSLKEFNWAIEDAHKSDHPVVAGDLFWSLLISLEDNSRLIRRGLSRRLPESQLNCSRPSHFRIGPTSNYDLTSSLHLGPLSGRVRPETLASNVMPKRSKPSKSSERSAGYGRSCLSCSKAKAKCTLTARHITCDRCSRLGLDCQRGSTTRKRKVMTDQTAHIARLEHDIASLSSTLTTISQLSQHAIAQSGAAALQSPVISDLTRPLLDLPLTRLEQKLCLDRYRKWLVNFPFVRIDGEDTVESLSVERPFLWSCMTCVTCPSAAQQRQLADVVRREAARRIIFEHERNMDLMLGLLSCLVWYSKLSSRILRS
ncbi:hypothetical protein ANO11243_017820 [Dothideomycetidae sp. 11243]|nr:hypothetical protein ANO11243_017820 [fungal sp. No.11243]